MVLAPQLTDSEKPTSKQLKEKIMKYGELTLGQVEALVNKLGGMEGVQRFLSGELFVSATARVWKTWKTIKLGTGFQTADDFRKEVKSAGMKIQRLVNDILDKHAFTVATCKTEVELVVASVAELGFKNGATRKDIYIRAEELGLNLCPFEVGPQLRLQYTDQPKGKWLIIAMEPITDSAGHPHLFNVVHADEGCSLYAAEDDYQGSFWGGDCRFVFLRHK